MQRIHVYSKSNQKLFERSQNYDKIADLPAVLEL